MGTYLQQYGEGDEQRIRKIKRIVIVSVLVIVVLLVAYFVRHDYPEKQEATKFLALVNEGRYQDAYRAWGCTDAQPCPNYDFHRFMEDWGPSKDVTPPWKIASIDGCKSFVTINVQARGSSLQSLMVDRATRILGFAPAPECQEKKWRFRQFFHRLFGG